MRGSILLLLLLFCRAACAGESHEEWQQHLPGAPPPAARVQQIDTDLRAAFDAALREYDSYLARNHHDVASHLQRCQFIDEFMSNYEYASFRDLLAELSSTCVSKLQASFPQHPEITLAALDRNYGKERLRAAEQALAQTPTQSWTNGQLARLYTLLANTADDLGDRRSGEFAREALALDERADVRVLLARKLWAEGRRGDLIEVLTSGADGHDPADGWYLIAKMQLLAEAAARPQVLSLYSLLRSRELDYDALSAVRALRMVRALGEARWELDRVQRRGTQQLAAARERFRFELEFGGGSAALAAYNQWRASGWRVDPLGINRVALLVRQPWLPWQWHDLVGVAMLLLALTASATFLTMPIALVHYRGLARRAHACETYPHGDWRLRDAWYALFAFLVPSIMALYCVGPLDVQLSVTNWGVDADPRQLSRIALVESLLTLALLMPLAQLAKQHEVRWWATQWSVARSVLIGAAVGIALRGPLLAAMLTTSNKLGSSSVQQPLWQLLSAIREQHGALSALWLLVMFAPVVEEFVFRGVLLRAFAAHLHFAWANVLQAALFAALHADLKAAPGLFLLALTAGWLARRSGGLLAPMALHAVFNLVAGTVLLHTS